MSATITISSRPHLLGNISEALSSSAGMRRAGRSATYVFGLWFGIFLMIGVAAAIAALALRDTELIAWVWRTIGTPR